MPIFFLYSVFSFFDFFSHVVGIVGKASASRVEDVGFDSSLRHRNFSGSSQTSDLKVGTPVAALPGASCYRVSAGTGWPVSVHCDWMR